MTCWVCCRPSTRRGSTSPRWMGGGLAFSTSPPASEKIYHPPLCVVLAPSQAGPSLGVVEHVKIGTVQNYSRRSMSLLPVTLRCTLTFCEILVYVATRLLVTSLRTARILESCCESCSACGSVVVYELVVYEFVNYGIQTACDVFGAASLVGSFFRSGEQHSARPTAINESFNFHP